MKTSKRMGLVEESAPGRRYGSYATSYKTDHLPSKLWPALTPLSVNDTKVSDCGNSRGAHQYWHQIAYPSIHIVYISQQLVG